jgi:hypothetical protein
MQVGLEALDAAHKAALEAAVREFSGRAVGAPAEQEPFLHRLRDAAAAQMARLRQVELAQAEARAVERLNGAARRFMAVGRPAAGRVRSSRGSRSKG